MLAEIDKYITVFTTSMVKFVIGPLVAVYQHLTITEAAITTILGAMTTVIVLSFIGEKARKLLKKIFYKNKRLFTSKNRKRVRFIKSYGLKGVAFLTPVLFGPVVGTMLASSMGEPKKKIVTYMFASSVFWALLLSILFHHAANFEPLLSLIKA